MDIEISSFLLAVTSGHCLFIVFNLYTFFVDYVFTRG